MKCVLDTDVLVASLRSAKGASREIVRLIGQRRVTAFATAAMLLEYEAVLTRPLHLDAANLTVAQVEVLLDGFAHLFVEVTPHFLWRPQLKDPADEMILEAAINGGVGTIVTFNLRHFGQVAERFGIDVMTPSQFLRRFRDEHNE